MLWSSVIIVFTKRASRHHHQDYNDAQNYNDHHYHHSHPHEQHQHHQQASKTGAWANCTFNEKEVRNQQQYHHYHDSNGNNNDIRSTVVSCHSIQYKINKSSILGMKQSSNPIVIGILSAGGNDKSFERRQTIRDTWAYNQTGIFFLVAQPFSTSTTTTTTTSINHHHNDEKEEGREMLSSSSLQDEYETYGDLIWINEKEVYNGETSVLTYKTLSFVNIIHDIVLEVEKEYSMSDATSSTITTTSNTSSSSSFVKYLFKTDDDSYIHMQNLNHHLLSPSSLSSSNHINNRHDDEDNYNRHYWGQCKTKEVEPLRSKSNKWAASLHLYPEPLYPKYCQGAGFALSWKFVHCAATGASSSTKAVTTTSSNNSHIANARYMPFEDVAVGLIAQRCDIEPTKIENESWIHMYRFERSEEKDRVNQGLERMPKRKLPKPNMDNGRFVQHRIYDDWDMKEHHKVALDKERYDRESKVEWYYRPEQEE
jgi:hypothetical protein